MIFNEAGSNGIRIGYARVSTTDQNPGGNFYRDSMEYRISDYNGPEEPIHQVGHRPSFSKADQKDLITRGPLSLPGSEWQRTTHPYRSPATTAFLV